MHSARLARLGFVGVRFSSTQSRYKTTSIPNCSEPACAAGLDIDFKSPLTGTAPAYSEQILFSTGKSDWTSRIEDDEQGGFARELKSLLGPKGRYFNPYRNLLLTCSSFSRSADNEQSQIKGSQQPATTPGLQDLSSTSVCLLPSFLYVPAVPSDASTAEKFVETFLKEDGRGANTKNLDDVQHQFPGVRRMNSEVVVLICSHGTRDSRCGVIGQLLQAKFKEQLKGIPASDIAETSGPPSTNPAVDLAAISHIGGHRWAGNVIIYFSPWKDHPQSGRGIWYGRVMPDHVQDIIQRTINDGQIIQELFRGGIDQDRSPLRLESVA